MPMPGQTHAGQAAAKFVRPGGVPGEHKIAAEPIFSSTGELQRAALARSRRAAGRHSPHRTRRRPGPCVPPPAATLVASSAMAGRGHDRRRPEGPAAVSFRRREPVRVLTDRKGATRTCPE